MRLVEFLHSIGVQTFNTDSEAFAKGVGYADEMEYVSIPVNNVWGGRAKDGGSVSSYEKVGYHAGSVDFIVGVLCGGCPVYVYRADDDSRIIQYQLEGS